jgi:hypothetical protein
MLSENAKRNRAFCGKAGVNSNLVCTVSVLLHDIDNHVPLHGDRARVFRSCRSDQPEEHRCLRL